MRFKVCKNLVRFSVPRTLRSMILASWDSKTSKMRLACGASGPRPRQNTPKLIFTHFELPLGTLNRAGQPDRPVMPISYSCAFALIRCTVAGSLGIVWDPGGTPPTLAAKLFPVGTPRPFTVSPGHESIDDGREPFPVKCGVVDPHKPRKGKNHAGSLHGDTVTGGNPFGWIILHHDGNRTLRPLEKGRITTH